MKNTQLTNNLVASITMRVINLLPIKRHAVSTPANPTIHLKIGIFRKLVSLFSPMEDGTRRSNDCAQRESVVVVAHVTIVKQNVAMHENTVPGHVSACRWNAEQAENHAMNNIPPNTATFTAGLFA